MSWYKCLACLPVGDVSKFMDTMMGVKEGLGPELQSQLGSIRDSAPRYNALTKLKLGISIIYRGIVCMYVYTIHCCWYVCY